MAKLDTSTCPKCGAPLDVHRGTTEVTCGYCGNVALVDQERPRPPDAAPMMTAGPPRRSTALAIFPAVFGAAVAVAAAMSIRHRATSWTASNGSAGGGLSSSSERLSFDDSPMLADVDGDGTPDVVAHCQTYDSNGNETHFLAAYDGATGKQLWRSAPGAKDAFAGKRALVGSYVINVDELGKVQAFHLSNGTPAWSALLGEKAERFCADGSSVIIEARDDTYTRFDLATGKKGTIATTRDKRPSCAPVYASGSGETPAFRLIGWPDFAANGLPELDTTPGMSAHRALVPVVRGSGPSFLLGSKDKGTSVAMVAAVEGGKVTWKDVVPGVDALTTDVNVTTILAAAGGGRVVIPYGLRNEKGVRMACFDARSGTRVWDVQVHGASNVESGLTIEAGRVYYASWTALHVLSLADGKRVFMIGHDF